MFDNYVWSGAIRKYIVDPTFGDGIATWSVLNLLARHNVDVLR